jgi:high-affinity nickel-transport protein
VVHAAEPDHLAAVSALVVAEKRPRAVVRYAATWGAGHALVLLAVGGALLAARAQMPARLADACELAVAAMLVALGVRALRSARQAPHSAPRGAPLRALLVGMVHGLAGSGALAALVVVHAPSVTSGLVFIALYGLGAASGMATIAGVVGLPLARVARSARVALAVSLGTGALSVAVGAAWAWPIARRWFG